MRYKVWYVILACITMSVLIFKFTDTKSLSEEKHVIFNYVSKNEAKIHSAVREIEGLSPEIEYFKNENDELYQYSLKGFNYIPEIAKVRETALLFEDDIVTSIHRGEAIVFYVGGYGNFSAATDYGFYYTSSDEPMCIDLYEVCTGIPLKRESNGWAIDREKLSSGQLERVKHVEVYTEKICDNYYWYETYTL